MIVLPYKPEHAIQLQSLGYFPHTGTDAEAYAKQIDRPGLAFTGFIDNVPVISAGLIPLWVGVAEAWALVTDRARKYPLSMHRAVKTNLYRMIKENNFHRVQMVVARGYGPGYRWAEGLGFKFEGFRLKYAPDKSDVVEYALTF